MIILRLPITRLLVIALFPDHATLVTESLLGLHCRAPLRFAGKLVQVESLVNVLCRGSIDLSFPSTCTYRSFDSCGQVDHSDSDPEFRMS